MKLHIVFWHRIIHLDFVSWQLKHPKWAYLLMLKFSNYCLTWNALWSSCSEIWQFYLKSLNFISSSKKWSIKQASCFLCVWFFLPHVTLYTVLSWNIISCGLHFTCKICFLLSGFPAICLGLTKWILVNLTLLRLCIWKIIVFYCFSYSLNI